MRQRVGHQWGQGDLRLRGGELGGVVRCFFFLKAQLPRTHGQRRLVCALQRLGRGSDGGGRHERDGRDLADDLQQLRVVAGPRRGPVAEGALAGSKFGGEVAFRGPGAAGQHREQHALVERGLVLEAGLEVDQVRRLHHRPGKGRGAGAGGALPEPVPVVPQYTPGWRALTTAMTRCPVSVRSA